MGRNIVVGIIRALWSVLLMLTVIGRGSGVTPSCEPLTQCPGLPYQLYRINDVIIPTKITGNALMDHDTSDCSLHVEDVLSQCGANTSNGDTIRHVALIVNCKFRRRVVFERTSMIGYSNAVLQIQTLNCRLGLDDINWLGTVTDLRVLQLINTDILRSSVVSPDNHTYDGLRNVVSLAMSNTNSTNRLETMFPRTDVFRSLAEVQFHNMSIHELPDDFPARMPRLQSLDLPQNSLTHPPSIFPWSSSDYSLPRNFSRTRIFNTLYTTQMELSLPPHLFRRTFHLGHNKIRTLGNFTFKGRIQLISVPDNGLTELGEETFANVTGLEKLDMSMNKLTSLLPETFQAPGMIDLQHLYLQSNRIAAIANQTFQGVPNLVNLNLANNELVRIEAGTFSSLLNLKTLHLENNRLEYVSRGSLPLKGSELTELFLNNNNFKQIPSDVFLLRSMRMVDLSDCQISLRDISETLAEIPLVEFQYVLLNSVTRVDGNFDDELKRRTKPYTRVINLENNNIDTIPVIPIPQYNLMLIHYRLDLLNNPLSCFCNMADFITHTNTAVRSDIFDGSEYFFTDLKCTSPSQYAGRTLMSLNPKDLYCAANVANCPDRCQCWTYYGSQQHIVDCSVRLMSNFPSVIPDGTIELRLEHNNISTLPTSSELRHLTRLDLSHNAIGSIPEEFFSLLPNLKILNLKHNGLTGLPRSIQQLELVKIRLADNHFRCDCQTKWIKKWINTNKGLVHNWDTITCVRPDEKVSPLNQVPDGEFVCHDDHRWKYTHTVATVLSLTIVFILIIAIVCRYFWLDIKALLFARFNLRLCERIEQGQDDMAVDVFVLSSSDDLQWTHEHVFKILEGSNLFKSLAQCFKHFIAGLSLQDNFDVFIDNSYKMVAVLSDSFFVDESLVYALERAVQKTLKQRRNYVILIQHGAIPSGTIKNEQLRRFLRTQKMLKPTDNFIKEKLLYSASSKSKFYDDQIDIITPWKRCLLQALPKTDRPCRYDFYLAYGEKEYAWSSENIRVRLEDAGWVTCVPDRDFMPGSPKDEIIVESLQESRYVVLVLSNSFANDEWSTFVFRATRQITIKECNNYLIVVVTEGTDISCMNEDIQSYLRTHTYLSQDDPNWWQNLIKSVIPDPGVTKIGTTGPAPDVVRVNDIDV